MWRLCIALVFLSMSASAQAEKLIVPPKQIVRIAENLSYKDFPKKLDILAIIRVESSFNPLAMNPEISSPRGASNGLMQVQNGSFDIHTNMYQGVGLLREYYRRLGSREAAVKAYNIGIGQYQRGKAKISAEQYWQKFKLRRSEYKRFYAK